MIANPKIFGYGEDGLTLLAISTRLDEVLREVGDQSKACECIVFFRPSFGRKGPSRKFTETSLRRAEFGEFDAIIGTPKAVYLIEAKWGRRAPRNQAPNIPDGQLQRHQIFRHIRESWMHNTPQSWSEFEACASVDYNTSFPSHVFPRSSHQLSHNLVFVLDALKSCGGTVKDICLYFYPSGTPKLSMRECAGGFQLIQLEFDPIDSSLFFRIQS
jgi:hypothetical protein